MTSPILPLHITPVSSASGSKSEITPTQSTIQPEGESTDDRPWKYVGYRLFSRWLRSDKAFFAFRKFSTLHARVILGLQDDISLLEEQLDLLETFYSRPGPEDFEDGSFRRDTSTERKTLLEKIRIALETYETTYITHTDDLIALNPSTRSPLYHLLRHTMELTGFFPRIFRRLPTDELAIDGHTSWYDDRKFERVAYAVICFVGLGMFIVPFWMLSGLAGTEGKLGVVTGFVVLFYGVVALGTTARAFESLAAAAA
ncbi:hypothetical protein HYFRA_00001573 [Hymenoscyphus fraxineus]|uniref:DUF6594 domain-containing protein n=1 Tax=Hymenoscyphus fraxineus TaxID=746836 RepID=A0A9N9L551_9HELO|nr:hypothetical protein HYFRA_00001573 [Hymenoscyphus fraxineus]